MRFVFVLLFIGSNSRAQQVMMQGFYWDYPKAGNGFNWCDTIRVKSNALQKAGITHLWLPPWSGNGPQSGGYDPKDLFIGNNSTLTSLGTKQQLMNLIDTLNAKGITTVADLVYNHRDGGSPESNGPVKDYVLNYAGNSNGNCPNPNDNSTSTFKKPYPADRYRMIIPIGGSTGLGAGTYTVYLSSRTATFTTHKYMFYATTTKAGGGSRWQPIATPDSVINEPLGNTNSPISLNAIGLGKNYKVTIDFNGDDDALKITLNAANFNAAGDTLILQAINVESGASNHRPWAIQYRASGASTDLNIADWANPWNSSYKLQFQTYTNFNGLASGRGGMDFRAFRPNWSGTGNLRYDGVNVEEPAAGASTTCLGPDWSRQSMDYFYDYDHTRKMTYDTLINWTKWTYSTLKAKALRLDAIKHFEPFFMADVLKAMFAAGQTPDLVVGEWYGEENPQIQDYVNTVQNSLNAAGAGVIKFKVFDFLLRNTLKNVLDNGQDARTAFSNSLRDSRGMSGYNIVTFLNNHDFRDDNATWTSSVARNNSALAYAYLLTNNQLGVPCVFYPDYYGYPTTRTDGTPFSYHPSGFVPVKKQVDQLIAVNQQFIKNSPSVDYLNRYSTPYTNNYISGAASQCLIYQLEGTASNPNGKREVIVAINFGTTNLRVDHQINDRSGTIASGTVFTDILGNSKYPIQTVNAGKQVYIDLPPKSFSVWVQGSPCPKSYDLANVIAPSVTMNYQASDFITSKGTISATANTQYKAGNAVFLTPGFKADSGSTFLAYISGCL